MKFSNTVTTAAFLTIVYGGLLLVGTAEAETVTGGKIQRPTHDTVNAEQSSGSMLLYHSFESLEIHNLHLGHPKDTYFA